MSFEGKPKPLPLQVISGLMLRCDASGTLLPPKSLSEGDSVEMLTGPFANFVATVDTIVSTASKTAFIIASMKNAVCEHNIYL